MGGLIPVYVPVQPFYWGAHLALLAAFGFRNCLWVEAPPGSLRDRFLTKGAGTLRNALLLAGLLLAGKSLLRRNLFFPATAWVFVAFYCRRAIPRPSDKPRAPFRTRAATVVVFILSLVLAAAIVEIGVRQFVPPPPSETGYYRPYPGYIYTLAPNAVGYNTVAISPTGTKRVPVEISQQGLRDRVHGPKAPDEFRILMLGDSLTMGFATLPEDSIPQCLERILAQESLGKRVTVINAGVTGYGPWQERRFLSERGFPLEPDLVILQMFPENDIGDTLGREGKFLDAYNEPWFDVVAQYRYGEFWQVRLPQWLLAHWRGLYALDKALSLNVRFVHVWNAACFLKRCNIPRPPPNEDRPFWIETDLAEWYPKIQKGFDRMLQDVDGIQRDCRERHVDFWAYCLPNEYAVNHCLWTRTVRDLDGVAEYEYGKTMRVAEQGLETLGIPFFSIVELLRERDDVFSLYYRDDGHLTEKGCACVAALIRDHLLSRYFPGKDLGASLPLAHPADPESPE